jgi:two-component system, sensor histidine kinase
MRRHLSIKLLLPSVTALTTLVLVAILAIYAAQALQRSQTAGRIPAIVDISYDLFASIQDLRLERGTVNIALAAPEIADAELRTELAQLRAQSGRSLDAAVEKLAKVRIDRNSDAVTRQIADIRNGRDELEQSRRVVDAALILPQRSRDANLTGAWLAAHGKLVRAIDGLSSQLENELSHGDSFVAEMISVKQIVWPVRSETGDDRLLVREVLAGRKPFSTAVQREISLRTGRIDGLWSLLRDKLRFATTPEELRDAITAADDIYFTQFRPLRGRVLDEIAAGGNFDLDRSDWERLAVETRSSMYLVAKTAYKLASEHSARQSIIADREFLLALGLALVFFIIGALAILYVIKGVVQPISNLSRRMSQVAEGGSAGAIPYENRSDEIGSLARSLHVFRDNAIEGQRLHHAKLAAEEASAIKSRFLANMSHEIRTPLNGVIGIAGALEKTHLTEKQREMVRLILSSGETLEALLSDILDVSKIESGKFSLHHAGFDLREAVETAAHVLRQRADDKGVGFEITYGPTARGLFIGDAVRVRQIVSNLTSNAVKFTAEGRVSIHVDVTEPEKPDGPALLSIGVEDTGIGFDAEAEKRLFGRFEQADGSITRNFGGTGLGLSIVKSLVSMMGGTLSAISTPGMGSRFGVTLPMPRHEALADYDRRSMQTRATRLEDGQTEPSFRRTLRVLLAEDNATNQLVVGLALEAHGAQLTITSNGSEAVEAFGAGSFDIVLMDMQMPVMDGLAATRAIRAIERENNRPRTPVAMLSANAMKEHIDLAVEAGCDSHIAKPFTVHMLIEGIKALIGGDASVGTDATPADKAEAEPSASGLEDLLAELDMGLSDRQNGRSAA